MVLWTSSILWFTRYNCALRESVKFEESVSGSGELRGDALGVDVGRLTASPEGVRSDSSESWGKLSAGCKDEAAVCTVVAEEGSGSIERETTANRVHFDAGRDQDSWQRKIVVGYDVDLLQ
ncbi:hypothetical protein B296_00008820 [Ensete ventricosum]|uniref:Uncharacterized protein n=1 Tax=Ensete ventricosum TaxID=4639 RepID=A0A427B7H4_ENSVE|nr:hypothetical protein B296_00008820 [Ensete ventricosum]